MEAARTIERLKQLGDILSGPANTVKRLAALAWKVLTFSPGEAVVPASCLCAEIGKGRVDIIHASRKFSKLNIKAEKTYRYAEDSLPSPDEVASALAVAFKDFGIGKTDVVLVVPKQWVVVKSAGLPAAAGENLSQVVMYELDRFTPFSSDEAYYDYLVGGKTADKIDLSIAAAKASTITEYTDKLTERGVAVKRVSFDLSSLATACRFATGKNSFIFAGVDRNGIKGGVVDAGILKTAAVQEFKGDDDLLMSVIVEDFLADQNTYAGASSEGALTIVSFQDEMNSLQETLKSRAVATFEVLNGMDRKLARPAGNGITRASLAGGAIEQLWPPARGFNLLSKGIRERARKPFLLTALLAIIIASCVVASFFVPISTEQDRLKEIDRQINMRREEVRNVEKSKDQIDALNKKMALINNFKHDKPLYINLTKELTLIIPKNAWLTRVRIAGPLVNIEGYAPSATSLIQILEASKYFEKAEFSSPTFRDARMNMDRFQIKTDIRGVKPEGAENEKK
jgi:Tfp pilus assembly protein PilN